MSQPHRIRIRGPWQYVLEGGDSGTVRVPGPWQIDCSIARLQRYFNWLAELSGGERVFIVFTGCGGTGTVSLNGDTLGPIETHQAEFEITDRLRPRNLLELDLSFDGLEPEAPRGLWADVLLEVRTDG